MPKVFACPFWRYEKNGFSYCQGGSRIRFRRVTSYCEYQRTYCLQPKDWEQCTIAQEILKEEENRGK